MNAENTTNPGQENENNQSKAPERNEGSQEQAEIISLPQTDRPEGPFPHSGETAGRTDAEEKEAEEQS